MGSLSAQDAASGALTVIEIFIPLP